MTLSLRSAVVVALSLSVLGGCPESGPKTHPVAGKVQLQGGDIAMLAGSTIELKHNTDELLRPYGNLDAAGNFTLKTLYQGQLLTGAPEGEYTARILLGDESDEGVPKRKGEVIHRRYLDFPKSGIKLTVPSSDYNVSLSK